MEKMIDPVCGMKVKGKELTSLYGGKNYYFCNSHCKEEFDRNPLKYTR